MKFPSSNDINQVLFKCLQKELQDKQELLLSCKSENLLDQDFIKILSQIQDSNFYNFSLVLDSAPENQNQVARLYYILLVLDLLFWSIAIGLAFTQFTSRNNIPQYKQIKLVITNQQFGECGWQMLSENSELVVNCSIKQSVVTIPKYQEIQSDLERFCLITDKLRTILIECVKPLEEMFFEIPGSAKTFKQFELSVEKTAGSLKRKVNDPIFINNELKVRAEMIGLQDFKSYSCPTTLENMEGKKKNSSMKLLKIQYLSELSPQRYYLLLILENQILCTPILITIYKSNEKNLEFLGKARSDENLLKNKEKIIIPFHAPFHIIGKVNKISQTNMDSHNSLIYHLEIQSMDISSHLKYPPKVCNVSSKVVDSNYTFINSKQLSVLIYK